MHPILTLKLFSPLILTSVILTNLLRLLKLMLANHLRKCCLVQKLDLDSDRIQIPDLLTQSHYRLYDVKIELSNAENSPEGISTTYIASKAAKSDPVDLKLDSTTQFNFKTFIRYNHDGQYYYMTLGSIGERHVEFFIWNGVLDLVETVSFRTNKWCKVGDFIFNLKSSTNDAADLFVKKQTT